MKFLLTSIGSSGDINPFIAIALALRERGHEPVLLVNPYFEATVRSQGLTFEPLGDYQSPADIARDKPLAFSRAFGPLVLVRQVFAPILAMMHEAIEQSVRTHRPDALVGHQISFTLPWVAQQTGLPWATAALAPATVLSALDPPRLPIGLDLTRMPMWYRRFAHWSARRVMSFLLDVPLNRLRRDLGRPPHHDTFFGEMLSGDAVLGMWSPHFRPKAGDDPTRLTVCGFPWFDRKSQYGVRGHSLDPALERFLDEGDPPVIFTLGSVLSHTGARVYDAAARACRSLGVRGVLVIGRDSSAPRSLPPGVLCVDYAPYSALLPRGSVVIHHGGIGTTAQALRAGRPTVILPHAHDQFDNAARMERLGVSVTLTRGQTSHRAISGALERILSDRSAPGLALDLGRRIAAEDGAARAAEIIEGLPARGAGSGRTDGIALEPMRAR